MRSSQENNRVRNALAFGGRPSPGSEVAGWRGSFLNKGTCDGRWKNNVKRKPRCVVTWQAMHWSW
jgi:hypothetical protein